MLAAESVGLQSSINGCTGPNPWLKNCTRTMQFVKLALLGTWSSLGGSQEALDVRQRQRQQMGIRLD